MQIDVTGHHVEITPALKDYVLSKIQKVEKHYDKITHVHTILSVEKTRQKAEATVYLAGADIYADSESEDMYSAIDQLSDKLIRQIQKHKEKQRG